MAGSRETALRALAAGELGIDEQRRERIRAFFALPDASDDRLDALFADYPRHYEAGWCPIPGSLEVVFTLVEQGLPVAVLTNGSPTSNAGSCAGSGATIRASG